MASKKTEPLTEDPSAPMTLRFLGAAGTVTGSKHLIKALGREILLDCGMFQGLKELRVRNWRPFPIPPKTLDAIILSHAHIDHSGYLPVLTRTGYRGPIYCTPPTAALLPILLYDAAYLQEEDAARANRKGYTKHKPALPLFTKADVDEVLKRVEEREFGQPFKVAKGIEVIFRRAGHILGSASIELRLGESSPTIVVFSGDLGRGGRETLKDPELVPEADFILVESTYGNKLHTPDALTDLARIVTEAAQRGGALIIPAFAVDRTQELIWSLKQLENSGRIPILPIAVDSPMSREVTEQYLRFPDEHRLPIPDLMDPEKCPLRCRKMEWIQTPDESKSLNSRQGPFIIISASGMATGGRVLHHLANRLGDPRTTVMFAGFQSAGTRGRTLQDGAKRVRIHGQEIPVQAQIRTLEGLSAHADRDELMAWLRGFQRPPRECFLVHGESDAAHALAQTIRKQLGWSARVPTDDQEMRLDESQM